MYREEGEKEMYIMIETKKREFPTSRKRKRKKRRLKMEGEMDVIISFSSGCIKEREDDGGKR